MNGLEVWKILGESETSEKPVHVTFDDGSAFDGTIVWSEGRNDSESGEDEAILEIDKDQTVFFFVKDVKDVSLIEE